MMDNKSSKNMANFKYLGKTVTKIKFRKKRRAD
jgi:hypothetical protein